MSAVLRRSGDSVLRILGPIEIEGPAGPVWVTPGRQQVVLALLLMEANQVVSTDQIVDTLWNQLPPDTARTQVQICVSRLRKKLADAGVDLPIVTRMPGYQLLLGGNTLDSHVFAGKLAEARVLVKEGRAAEAVSLLRSAVALWRGPCLSGLPNPALRARALRLDEDLLTATEDYLELELELGRHHQIVGEVTRLVHEHPMRERMRAVLMLALHRAGRPGEALEAFRTGRHLLVEELGLEPGERLRLLESAILAGDTAGGRIEPGPPVPPPAPSFERPRQLPADTADFVGNEALIRTAEAVLVGGDRRAVGVVVVIGRPGSGKTTVAAHIGHRVADRFPDGQLYCDLRGTREEPTAAADVLGRFLLALGIPGTVIPMGLDERVEMYRTLMAERRTLVVLDDASAESQVIPLLPGSNTCAVLVTSRSRLTGVPGARQVEVEVFDAAQSLDLLGRVIGGERVAREPEAAAALVRTVGGLPLALRIIAARLAARPHWSLASMVHRLASERHRLDELAHGEMTIRASLSLTHNGMDRRSRTLFGLLGLGEGPELPGWVAGAVLDDDSRYPSDLLEPLVDVQMLDVTTVERTGEFRYRYQDIVRLFALEKLNAEVPPDMRRRAVERLLGGWLALAEQAHRSIYGGDYAVLHGTALRWLPPSTYVQQVSADPLEWLDGEQANLCAAISQAADAGFDEACWDLAVTAATLFESHGYLDDWEKTHEKALQATRAAGNARGTAAVLSSLGTLYINRGQPTRAHEALTTALTTFQELDDPRGLALCRRDLGLLARWAGDDDEALVLYADAMRDLDRAKDLVGRGIVLTHQTDVLCRRGRTDEATAQLLEAIMIFEGAGYRNGIPHALRRIGQVQVRAGRHQDALVTFTRVLGMVRESRDVIGEGHLLRNLGEVNARLGQDRDAKAYFEQALVARERIMDHVGAAAIRVDLAPVLARLGDSNRASELVLHAVRIFGDRGMERERVAAEEALTVLAAGR
ncbi:AfsR/SARP family transcriptional regulator [Lentzea sp. NEAU-D7]|uniref:AfsR/SARP family transcriptional regulator n=1 Tax=Lentzea sp. NEAU-D7 TaxID=2994667 RepID=UPI00224B796E|nr:BTAD domain-containing putative transcriptional regulator [Lentzea sp. NEAU-D7]MCX2947035.1 BTAD domain-containing putative transcriptional regulator [Lentzea sp. NEAU-D7]